MKKSFFNILLACLLTFSFFLPNLISGKIPIPADDLLGLYHPWRDQSFAGFNPGKFPVKNPLITDPVLQTYPWRAITIGNIKEGYLPLWNPYSFSGQPLAANIQSAPFSALNVLFFILPFKIAWAIQIILPEILTSLFMYLYLKSQKLSSPAAIFGSFVLPFSGFFVAWMAWGTIATTAMWLPLILFCLQKLTKRISAPFFLLLTFAFSQTIFSGHTQTAFYVFLASFLYLLFLLKTSPNRKNITVCVASLILGIIIAAPQILPSIDFIKLSARNIDQGYYPNRQDWFLPPQNLLQLIAPDFFGNPATYNYWGVWNYAEFVSFVGIIPLSLVLFSLFRKQKEVIFFILLAAVSLVLALPNFVSKIPYIYHFPYVSSLQPSRIIFLWVFSLTVLSAFGFDYFLNNKNKKIILLPAILIFTFLISLLFYTTSFKSVFPQLKDLDTAYIAYRNLLFPMAMSVLVLTAYLLKFLKVPKGVLVIIIFTLTAIDLFRFGLKFTAFSKPSWIFPKTDATTFLENQQKPFRVMATDRRILHPNTSGVYKIETVEGYDPLYLTSYAKLISVWESKNANAQVSSFNRIVTPQNYDSRIADLLGTKYILTFDRINNPNFTLVFEKGETKIYQNSKALPRFFFAKEIDKEQDQNHELSKILDPNTDLSARVTSLLASFSKTDVTSKIDINSYSDQSIDLTTTTDKTAPLVVGNINYPGWQAKIDGRKTQIDTVDFTLQSVMVPAGTHQINFKFAPQSFYNGLYMGAFGLVAALVSAFYIWHKKYQ